MTVIKWAARHGQLYADEYDTLDEAFRAAWAAAENGLEALECFEVVNEGRVIGSDDPEWKAFDRAISDRAWAATKARPKPVARLELREPSGDTWAPMDWFYDLDEARSARDGWVARLGQNRVRLKDDL